MIGVGVCQHVHMHSSGTRPRTGYFMTRETLIKSTLTSPAQTSLSGLFFLGRPEGVPSAGRNIPSRPGQAL